MGAIIDRLFDRVHEFLADTVYEEAHGMLSRVSNQIQDSADRIAYTPMEWQGGIGWGIVETVAGTAGTVIQTVAGLILGFFIALELVQMLIEKNNLADIDMISTVIKWVVKAFIAILIVSNAFVLIGAIFTIGQEIIVGASLDGIDAITDIDMVAFRLALNDLSIGALLGMVFQFLILGWIFELVGIAVFLIIVGRFFEIFMYLVAAPIPLATMANQEYRSMGNNYIKSLCALAFQGLLMLIVITIVGGLLAGSIGSLLDEAATGSGFFGILGYFVLMIFALMKSGAIAKSIFNAS